MKKTMKNAMIGLVFLFVAVTGVTAGKPVNSNLPELKFVQYSEQMPVIKLDLKNSNNEVYFIEISDETGLILYKEKVSGVNISRFYQLDKNDLYGAELVIKVKNASATTVTSFTIQNDVSVISRNIK